MWGSLLFSRWGLEQPRWWYRVVLASFLIALVCNVALWLLVVSQIGDSRESIALHYNIYFGVDNFGPAWLLHTAPLFGLVVLLTNFCLALYWVGKEKLLSILLVSATILIEFLLLVGGIAIAFFNR